VRISTYSSGTDICFRISTCPTQPPIGQVNLADYGMRVDVDDPAEARAIAVAFTDMASQLEVAVKAHAGQCQECGAPAPGHVMTCTLRTPMDDEAAPVDAAAGADQLALPANRIGGSE